MKKILCILLLFGLCVSVFANSSRDVHKCSPDEFVIMPWGFWWWTDFAEPNGNTDVENYFRDISECGFNVTDFVKPKDIKKAKKYGLMVSLDAEDYIDNSITNPKEKYNLWSKTLKNSLTKEETDNIFQIYIMDEPFIGHKDEIKAKSKSAKDVGLRPYITLLPKSPVKERIGDSYDIYCDTFIKNSFSDYIYYDSYSVYETKGLNEDRFFGHLEDVRAAAKRNNVNFINIILSNAHFNYSVPNDYSIKVQAWSSLAYGVKGISYFLFNTIDLGNYRNTAYYADGHRTSLWYIIQDMNFTIHKIMPYYKNIINENVFHIGNIPKGCNDIKSAKYIKKITADYNIETDSKPNLLVGEFHDSENRKYAIIVNKDQKYSIHLNEIEFKEGTQIVRCLNKTVWGNESSYSRSDDRWLAPGYGVLLMSK